jgi:hypothetical protein
MTKEELRSKILELEEAMREEDSKSTTAKLSDEWDELMSKLEDVIYDELEGVAVKIVTERIVDKYDVDTDILIAEYMESGDLEESFKIAAEECDWKTDITKKNIKIITTMTKEGFVKLIENAQNYSKELDRWSNFGIDLFELPISELGWGFLNTVLPELFSDEGVDWVNWWLFEKPGLFKNSLPNEAYDEDGNIIPTDTIDDLWNLVKDYQK